MMRQLSLFKMPLKQHIKVFKRSGIFQFIDSLYLIFDRIFYKIKKKKLLCPRTVSKKFYTFDFYFKFYSEFISKNEALFSAISLNLNY